METLMLMLGGVCFFLYGLQLTKDGLQHGGGDRLRDYLKKSTQSRWLALSFGTIGTFILQSSSVATAMLVGLANVGMIGVSNGLALSLGAGIGTSLFVLLLAKVIVFPIKGYAIFMLLIGFIFLQLDKKGGSNLGKIIMGFGLILYGIKLIAETGSFLQTSPLLLQKLTEMGETPLATIVIAALLTTLLQSSTATIGILLSLSLSGHLSLTLAVPVVLGANIGTTSTALLASLQSNELGKRIAVGQLILKVAGVLVLLPFLNHFLHLLQLGFSQPANQIAQAHLIFNVGCALLFTPFVSLVSGLLNKLIPQDLATEEGFQVKYLDRQVLDTPILAFGNVVREILRMADIVQDMFARILETFATNNLKLLQKLEEMDDRVDLLNREIKFYLARISQGGLSQIQAQQQHQLLHLTAALEEAGDVINRNLGKLVRKKTRHHLQFSTEGWHDIQSLHSRVLENINLSISAFATQHQEIARKVVRHKKHLSNIFEEMQQGHLSRLQEGLQESFATSALHMELLANIVRINLLVSKLAYAVLDRDDEDD